MCPEISPTSRLAPSLVDLGFVEAERVSDDPRRLARAVEVGCHDRVDPRVAHGLGDGTRLRTTRVGQRGVRSALPAPFGVPHRLAVTNQQDALRHAETLRSVRMALDIAKLGKTYDELTEVIDGDRAKAYAAATNDDNPAYTSGKYAPPVFAVVPAWAALGLAVGDVIPPDVLMMVVHGEQDMHFAAPLVPGVTLRTAAEAYSVRVGASGTRFTVRTRSVDDATGALIVEQYITVFVARHG